MAVRPATDGDPGDLSFGCGAHLAVDQEATERDFAPQDTVVTPCANLRIRASGTLRRPAALHEGADPDALLADGQHAAPGISWATKRLP